MVQTDEERKAKAREYRKKYNSSEKGKTSKKEYQKKYFQRPEVKEKARLHSQKPEVKEQRKRHRAIPKVKENKKKYDSNYQKRPEVKEKAKNERATKRLKILQTYSKLMSNSNVPCCNCCGENFHINFLAIDHILGRKPMDSEKELTKLGYSSTMSEENLMKFIIKNNYPKGFQILCHNCNFAKGMPINNNTCPHEIARKEETFAMIEEQSSFEAGF